MPRDIIQKDEFIDSIHKQVGDMTVVFNNQKNNLQNFKTIISLP